MKHYRSPLKWTLVVMIAAVVFIMVGYYTSILLKDKPVTRMVVADNALEEEMPAGDSDEIDENDTYNVIQVEGTSSNITTGKRSNAIQVEKDSINILILGEDKEASLYDTIGIASIDKKNKHMKIIMIPRDTYIEYDKPIMDVLKKKGLSKTAGVFKINNAHNIGRRINYKGKFTPGYISFVADVVKEKFGVEVNDFVKINTTGFVKLVDNFGGVKINVPYNMDYEDPMQDLYIHLKKGMQRLDGSQAEGFVRFRQGYKEDGTLFQIGDIKRKENQVIFIKEFIRQHGSIRNINKLPNMFKILDEYLKTSIGFGDAILNYVGVAKEIISNKYTIDSEILDGKQIRINGSAYIDIE
jgi:cell envelope-related function transcriptional attenuator common domain